MDTAKVFSVIHNIRGKGFFYLFSANLIVAFFGFGSQIIVGFFLSPEQIGIIKVAQNYLQIALVAATFGYNASIIKVCSENRPRRDVLRSFNSGLFAITGFSILVTFLLIVLAKLGVLSPVQQINNSVALFAIALIPMAINQGIMGYIQSQRRIKVLSRFQLLTKGVALVILTILTIYYGLNGYIWGIIIGFTLTMIILFFYSVKNNELKLYLVRKTEIKAQYKYSLFSFLANFVSIIALQIDVIILNYLTVNRDQLGYLSFALILIMGFQLLTSTIQQIAIPYFSNIDNKKKIANTYRKYKYYNIILTIVVVVLSVFLLPVMIDLIFKYKYTGSNRYLIMLIVSWGFRNVYSFESLFLFSTGFVKYNYYIALGNMFFMIGLVFIVYEALGFENIAIAHVLCALLTLFAYSRVSKMLRRKKGLI